MTGNQEHDPETHASVEALGQATAVFPPGAGRTVLLEYRGDGCVTWKELGK